jgi:hypothetical protein
MNNNNLIGLVLLLMSIVSLFVYLLNANGDGVFNTIETLSFSGIFLFPLSIPFLIDS